MTHESNGMACLVDHGKGSGQCHMCKHCGKWIEWGKMKEECPGANSVIGPMKNPPKTAYQVVASRHGPTCMCIECLPVREEATEA